MALFTPTNQKRLTNVSVVRLKKGGHRYELACYPNKVRSWRDKLETNLDEVLQAHCVFANVSKGQFANRKEMYIDFRTEDERQIIKTILEHGELQLTEKERLVEQQALFKDVAKIVSERCVNPENNRAYTATMVEKMMKDCHISLKANKNAKQHALEVIRQLRANPGFKIAPSMMEVIITIQKDVYESVVKKILELCNEVIRQCELPDGLCELAAFVEPENYGSIETFLHNEIKGKYCIEIADSTKHTTRGLGKPNPISSVMIQKKPKDVEQAKKDEEDIKTTNVPVEATSSKSDVDQTVTQESEKPSVVSNEKKTGRKHKQKHKKGSKRDDDWSD
ncbi:unnamed protein product [Trichobilharzia szidati]|nr:unnamed protein product [Trichobilharzia szidati]CAH8853905.1 unnamed protein product [Trichobilharzia szidati]